MKSTNMVEISNARSKSVYASRVETGVHRLDTGIFLDSPSSKATDSVDSLTLWGTPLPHHVLAKLKEIGFKDATMEAKTATKAINIKSCRAQIRFLPGKTTVSARSSDVMQQLAEAVRDQLTKL